jgi:hypothetical protein
LTYPLGERRALCLDWGEVIVARKIAVAAACDDLTDRFAPYRGVEYGALRDVQTRKKSASLRPMIARFSRAARLWTMGG